MVKKGLLSASRLPNFSFISLSWVMSWNLRRSIASGPVQQSGSPIHSSGPLLPKCTSPGANAQTSTSHFFRALTSRVPAGGAAECPPAAPRFHVLQPGEFTWCFSRKQRSEQKVRDGRNGPLFREQTVGGEHIVVGEEEGKGTEERGAGEGL